MPGPPMRRPHSVKMQFGNEELDRFDKTVVALHQFEDIRYPDNVLKLGAAILLDWNSSSGIAASSSSAAPVKNANVPSLYHLSVNDLDHLVAKIFAVCSRNPIFFMSCFPQYAREIIVRDNPVAAQLLTPST